MRYLALILLLSAFAFTSCKKHKINHKNYPSLVGTYEWAYSFNSANESESFQTITDRWGIVLKKNGTVKVYKNEEERLSGYAVEYYYDNQGRRALKILFENDMYVSFWGDNLEWDSYPIDNHKNIFQKQ